MILRDARIALPEAQKTQHQTGGSNKVKRPTPAKMGANQPTNHIAERAANWNRRVKNGHDATPCFDWEKIGQDGWRRGAIAAFTNSNAYASCKENRKCSRETGSAAGQAPQNHSRTDDDPTRESIGEQTKNRRADHVGYEKRVAEQTSLGHGVYVARHEKSCANIRLERGEDLPVDVVEKIDGQEQ